MNNDMKMRPCWFKESVKSEWREGLFHAWSMESDLTSDNQPTHCPVAIVELPDGTVKTVYAEHVRFEWPEDLRVREMPKGGGE